MGDPIALEVAVALDPEAVDQGRRGGPVDDPEGHSDVGGRGDLPDVDANQVGDLAAVAGAVYRHDAVEVVLVRRRQRNRRLLRCPVSGRLRNLLGIDLCNVIST